jgi:hypothetical protein
MKRILSAIAVIAAALTLSGCWKNTYTWNQKLSVTVETPDGERSGSAVTQVTATIGEGGLLPTNAAYTVKGEAAVVDLGNGKYLFALLANSGGNATEYWAVNNFQRMVMDNYPYSTEDLDKFYSALEKIRAIQTLASDRYPLLVTFGDLADPMSVREVKPRDLEAAFGTGYRLKSITLAITDETVTKGEVQKLLSWIQEYFDKHLDRNTIETINATNRLANSLASGNFTTWRD